MGRQCRDWRESQREQVQQGLGSCRLPKGQIALSIAVARRPGDLLTPFSGCRLPWGWYVVTVEEEPGPCGEFGSSLRPERDSAFLCSCIRSTHVSCHPASCRPLGSGHTAVTEAPHSCPRRAGTNGQDEQRRRKATGCGSELGPQREHPRRSELEQTMGQGPARRGGAVR